MADFVSSGLAVDLVLAVLLLEGVVLTLLYLRRGIGVTPARLWPMLGAGAGLLLALRAGITGAGWYWVIAGLLLALCAHLYDLLGRWQPRPN
ncbi:MAG: hypothetical protein JJT88_01900 [Gammaproteobacteria bacterium]|nr:hypothetical protein [Gammaproteobacteria bacterium]